MVAYDKRYNIADLYFSDSESDSSIGALCGNNEDLNYPHPDNTKTQVISKIAKGALALCGTFWAALAGLSLKYCLFGSALLVAGVTTPWGIAVLSLAGFLTIAAYTAHALSSERGTC